MRLGSIITFLVVVLSVSCSSNKEEPEVIVDKPKISKTISIDLTTRHQEMIGFGGGLTWYADRLLTGSKKAEMAQLLFEDMGTDIIRLKNWYYPINYPIDKSTTQMEYNFQGSFNATNEIYDLAKSINPDIQVLFSSWSPPSALKSNESLREGTLKKDDSGFMYDAFAEYWVDVMDHITFVPDYLSIQNEPSYTNPGWETCDWRGVETPLYPGYVTALTKIYDRLKDRPEVPKFMGPESENIGMSGYGQTFQTFADQLKNLDFLNVYGYHLYNYNSSSGADQLNNTLEIISRDYADKPNVMTEFSRDMGWLEAAKLIQNVVTVGNAAGYIYWDMVWDTNATALMGVTSGGSYQLSAYYYVLKHFAKYVDAGFQRVEATSTVPQLRISAFQNPTTNEVTLVIINTATFSYTIDVEIDEVPVSTIAAYQSIEGDNFSNQEVIEADDYKTVKLEAQSITTLVIK